MTRGEPEAMNSNRDKTLCAGVLVLTAALNGCTVGEDYSRPELITPTTFSQSTTIASTRPSVSATGREAWWETFDDAGLNRLIERAVVSNLEVRRATQRVVEARAQRGVVAGQYYPRVDGVGSVTRTSASVNTDSSPARFGAPRESTLWTAGLDASWELDVFGGTRRNVEAADADVGFAIEDRRDVLLTLLGDVAFAYIELRGAQNEIRVVEQNVDAQVQTLELTRTRARAGLISELDVAQSEAQVALTESRIPTLRAQARRAAHRLALLLGEMPATLYAELDVEAPLPTAAGLVPVGLPSELLLRRPDVRRAERQLAAATARVGVARADLYPRFNLTGNLGLQSQKLANLPEGRSGYWSIGPSVSWALLDFGRIRSNVDVQNARVDQALTTLEQAVLVSMEDVENALTNLEQERARRAKLAQSVDANRRAVELSRTLYDQGLADFINVLDAQRALFEAEDQLIQSEIAVSTNVVTLFKALGGGWASVEADASDTATTRPAQR
jgi:outer membrane protein, multidrug efflux system